jgi:uncharacterized delta-60 repeat protein
MCGSRSDRLRSALRFIEALEARQLLAVDAFDSTFSDNGATRVGLGKQVAFLRDIDVAPNGRLLLTGQAAGGGGWAAIAALLPDGTPDTSFADHGRIVYPDQNVPSEYLALAVAADGSMVAVGEHNINPEGSVDFDYYDSAGRLRFTAKVPKSAGLYDRAFAIELQPAPGGAKVVAAGAYDNRIGVFRRLPNGLPDTSFSGDGIATTVVSGSAYAMLLQGDKILVGGAGYPDSRTGKHPMVVRFTSSGDLDPTFGTAGQADLFSTVRNLLPAGEGEIRSMAFAADGKIVVFGKAGATDPGTMFIARLTADGALDSTFSSDGIVLLGSVNHSEGQEVQVEADGSILYAYSNYSSSGPDPFIPIVGRLTSAGDPDPRFGANGVWRMIDPPDAYPKTALTNLALQNDGKAIVGGYTCNFECAMYVLRLDGGFPGSASLDNGVLKITGTSHDDSVQVLNTFDGFIDVNINSQLAGHFPFAQVKSIQADLLAGDDLLTLEQAVFAPLTYNGNEGRDALVYRASNGSDNILINARHIISEGNEATISNVEDLTVDAMASTDSIIVDVGSDFAGTLRVDGNEEDDTFDVRSAGGLAGVSGLPAVQLIGGDGDDQFLFSSLNAALVGVEGNAGTDKIQFTGSNAADAGQILESQIGLGLAVAQYLTVEQVSMSTLGGDDQVTLGGAKAGMQMTLDAGSGDDQFTGQSVTNFHSAAINLIAADGNDTLNLSGASKPGLHVFGITPTSVSWSTPSLNLTIDASLENLQVVGGNREDRFDVTPSSTMAVSIDGLAPTINPGDVLRLTLGGATGMQRSADGFTFTNRRPINLANIETPLVPELDPPVVAFVAYTFGTGENLFFRFSEIVQNLELDDLTLTNLSTGVVIRAFSATSSNGTDGMTGIGWNFAAPLPDGHYRAEIPDGAVRDLAGTPSLAFVFNFDVLAGDLNGDGQVTIADFITLASNFGKTGATYSDGDLNYDHNVTIADFIALAANFGKLMADLPMFAAPQPAASASAETLSIIERNRAARTTRHDQRHLIRRHAQPQISR